MLVLGHRRQRRPEVSRLRDTVETDYTQVLGHAQPALRPLHRLQFFPRTIVAPVDGVVSQVNFKVGGQVSDGDALLAFEVEEVC